MTNIFKAALIAFFCTGSLAFAEDGAEPSELPSKKITVEHRTHPFLFGGRGVSARLGWFFRIRTINSFVPLSSMTLPLAL